MARPSTSYTVEVHTAALDELNSGSTSLHVWTFRPCASKNVSCSRPFEVPSRSCTTVRCALRTPSDKYSVQVVGPAPLSPMVVPALVGQLPVSRTKWVGG